MTTSTVKSALLAAGLLAGTTMPAGAVLQISALVNGTALDCADQQACDTNNTVGILDVGTQTLNGVTIFGTFQSQKIATAAGEINRLDTTSFNIENTTGAAVPIIVAVSGTDFAGPVQIYTASATTNFSEAIGSTFLLQFYGDATNTQGADFPTDHPGSLLTQTSGIVTLQSQGFSFNDAGPFVDPNLFSLTLFADAVLAANGTLTNRTQSIILEQVAVVDEPGGWLNLATGLGLFGGVGLLARRRSLLASPEEA